METIVFDIGETLVRDDRLWAAWADWLGVPPHTVSALVGAAVTQGRDSADALRLLRPGMDVGEAYGARVAAGRGEYLDERDLYPDVRPALAELRALGLRVVVAGNRSARAGELLRALALPADLVATSEEWGVAKPDQAFFERVLEVAEAPAHATLYVGDHPADDLFPARSCGLRAAHIRRGPYGHWWADHPEVTRTADWCVDSLTDLPALLGTGRTAGHRAGGTARQGVDRTAGRGVGDLAAGHDTDRANGHDTDLATPRAMGLSLPEAAGPAPAQDTRPDADGPRHTDPAASRSAGLPAAPSANRAAP